LFFWVKKRVRVVSYKRKKKINQDYLSRIILLNKNYPIVWGESLKKGYILTSQKVFLSLGKEGLDTTCLKKKVDQFYKYMAKQILTHRIKICLAHYKKYYPLKKEPLLKIRKMKRRLGSMNTQLHLVLNVFLVQLPIELIDAIIYHELCHIYFPHHQKSFYQSVCSVYPPYAQIHKVLKKQQFLMD
jgi:predicted metal-dependent hydrolase